MVCPNCGATAGGSPCSVCAYWPQRRGRYPIARDALTDSYTAPRRAPGWKGVPPAPSGSAGRSPRRRSLGNGA